MSRRIADFFLIDMIEEQHQFSIEQMAFFYETNTDEVVSALARANERYADNPLSTCYCDSNSDGSGHAADQVPTRPCGDVQCPPGKDRVEGYGCWGLLSLTSTVNPPPAFKNPTLRRTRFAPVST
jgi:hypothetical protein